jgi:hypothetical protein
MPTTLHSNPSPTIGVTFLRNTAVSNWNWACPSMVSPVSPSCFNPSCYFLGVCWCPACPSILSSSVYMVSPVSPSCPNPSCYFLRVSWCPACPFILSHSVYIVSPVSPSCCNPSCYVNYVSNWNLPLLPLSDVHFGFCLYTWRRYVNYRCYPPPSYRCWPFSVILFRHFSSPQRPNRPWSPSSPRYSLYNGYRRLNWQRYRSNHSFPNAEI